MTRPTDKPPEGCCYYESAEDVPGEIRKYWHQRHDLFSKFDEGVWLTDTSWYGVTPEPVADLIALDVANSVPADKTVLIDAFAGVGGNTIAFAKSGRWERIFAIEKDPAALKCAKHNSKLYGVSNKIWWIEGDCFQVLKTRLSGLGKSAVVFGSPPWGGPEYHQVPVFDLNAMEPYNLRTLHEAFTKYSQQVILYLPRTSDYNQLSDLVTDEKRLPVTHYCMRGASKALCVYYGNFAFA